VHVAAWVGFNVPPVAYAAWGSPAKTSIMPFAIINAPTTIAPTNATNPMRIAIRRLVGTGELSRTEAHASTMMMAISTMPPAANVRATNPSNVVSRLK
jgi:hypothetical protein